MTLAVKRLTSRHNYAMWEVTPSGSLGGQVLNAMKVFSGDSLALFLVPISVDIH